MQGHCVTGTINFGDQGSLKNSYGDTSFQDVPSARPLMASSSRLGNWEIEKVGNPKLVHSNKEILSSSNFLYFSFGNINLQRLILS